MGYLPLFYAQIYRLCNYIYSKSPRKIQQMSKENHSLLESFDKKDIPLLMEVPINKDKPTAKESQLKKDLPCAVQKSAPHWKPYQFNQHYDKAPFHGRKFPHVNRVEDERVFQKCGKNNLHVNRIEDESALPLEQHVEDERLGSKEHQINPSRSHSFPRPEERPYEYGGMVGHWREKRLTECDTCPSCNQRIPNGYGYPKERYNEGRFMDEQYYKTRHMPFENFGRRELPYRESSVPQYDERYPRNVHEDEQRRAASNKHTSCETYDYRSDSMPYSKYHLTRQIPRDVEHKSYDTRPFYDYNHKPASYVPHRDRYSEYEEHFYEHRG